MTKLELTVEQVTIAGDALMTYGNEIKKLQKKAEKMGLPEAETLKGTYLRVEALRDKLSRA